MTGMVVIVSSQWNGQRRLGSRFQAQVRSQIPPIALRGRVERAGCVDKTVTLASKSGKPSRLIRRHSSPFADRVVEQSGADQGHAETPLMRDLAKSWRCFLLDTHLRKAAGSSSLPRISAVVG